MKQGKIPLDQYRIQMNTSNSGYILSIVTKFPTLTCVLELMEQIKPLQTLQKLSLSTDFRVVNSQSCWGKVSLNMHGKLVAPVYIGRLYNDTYPSILKKAVKTGT